MRLPVGAGTDDPVALADLELAPWSCSARPASTSINSLTSPAATVAATVNQAQPLEDPPCLFDAGGITLDPDLAVSGKNLHAHSVTNLPENWSRLPKTASSSA